MKNKIILSKIKLTINNTFPFIIVLLFLNACNGNIDVSSLPNINLTHKSIRLYANEPYSISPTGGIAPYTFFSMLITPSQIDLNTGVYSATALTNFTSDEILIVDNSPKKLTTSVNVSIIRSQALGTVVTATEIRSVQKLLNGNLVALSRNPSRFLKSIDNGATWSSSIIGVSSLNFNSLYIQSETVIYAAGADSLNNGLVYKTIDGGNSWTLFFSHDPNASSCIPNGCPITHILEFPIGTLRIHTTLYSCAENCDEYIDTIISTNNGANWTSESDFYLPVVIHDGKKYGFNFQNNTLYETIDGQNYTQVSLPVSTGLSAVNLANVINGVLYLPTNVGLYRRTTSTATWEKLSTQNLESVIISSNNEFFGLFSGDLYRSSNASIWSKIVDSNLLSTSLIISNNKIFHFIQSGAQIVVNTIDSIK